MSLSQSMPATLAYPVSVAIPRSSRTARGIGRSLRAVISVLLAMDASLKLFQMQAAVEGSAQLGYSADAVLVIGIVETICLALYLVPRTAILGAVLWTGYLGGAVATHAQLGNPLFTHLLSPIYAATMLWLGLWLTDGRLRRVFDATR